jgi:TolB-like protein
MFTDIVGYTSLMGKDEDQAFKILKINREIHSLNFERYDGTLIKEMGDGILASFSSTYKAVLCALAIQEDAKYENIFLRIGIHVGEVVFEGGDVLGDGVNVASRLEETAEKGGINISGAVYKEIKNKAGINAKFIEEKSFKNIEEPIKIYKVYIEESRRKQTSKIHPKRETENSIAVLPFVNMSEDPSQEFFCDGMSEEIINALSHVGGLKVIARTSAFMFKGKQEDMREIGKKLDVETLLEGSVRKAGNRLRITAQLIKVSDGSHLWSERYDRELTDVFAIQDEMAVAIVGNLKVSLIGKQKKALLRRHTENFEANILYLRGRKSRQQKDLEGFNNALKFLNEAIELDPEFSLAYAEIAFTYVLMGWFCLTLVNDKLKEKIIFYAEKALKLDRNGSDAYIALALAWELIDNNQIKAEEFARKATHLNPGSSEAMLEYGFILGRMGQFKSAMEKMESAIILDPLSIMAHNGIGYLLYYQGHFKSAIKRMRYILDMDPNFFPAKFIISLSLTELEDYEEALKELENCPQTYLTVISHRGYIYAKMNRQEEAFRNIEEIKSKFNKDPLCEYFIALIYSGIGDKDNAFNWLVRSQNKYGFVYRDRTIGTDYRIKNLIKDKRYNDLTIY